MSNLHPFKGTTFPTMGIELELQLINLYNFNLATEASDLLRRIEEKPHSGEIKPEITQAMIELNSSIHENYDSLKTELINLRNIIAEEAYQTHIGVCGGGAHPFQKWSKQRIYPTERFANVSDQYGYLAKQFTVFGQHIHIACPSGDDALYLCHALARYIPHFIALSAASPFQQNVDTSFDCSRLAVVSAFPLSGTPPWLLSWDDFEEYFDKMFKLGIVKSMKDFYWDIRPKPEYGTVEIRICDTPLTVEKAADLAAFAQMLSSWLLDKRTALSKEIYLTYLVNRFRSARYGLQAILIDPFEEISKSISDDILQTCVVLEEYAQAHHSLEALSRIRNQVMQHLNDAVWLRERYADLHTLEDTVRSQTDLWMSGES